MDDSLRVRLLTVRRLATASSLILAGLLVLWFVMPGAEVAAAPAPAGAQCRCSGHASLTGGEGHAASIILKSI